MKINIPTIPICSPCPYLYEQVPYVYVESLRRQTNEVLNKFYKSIETLNGAINMEQLLTGLSEEITIAYTGKGIDIQNRINLEISYRNIEIKLKELKQIKQNFNKQ